MSVDQVEARILSAKRAFTSAKHEIATAHADLEQLFLDRHRVAWSEDLKLYDYLCNRRIRTQILTRLSLGLFLIGPITGLALWRLVDRSFPYLRNLHIRGGFSLSSQVKRIRTHITKHVSAWLRNHAAEYQAKSGYRIRGLDGPLCRGQPSSSNVPRASEMSVMKIRLGVASIGVTMVGFLVIAVTPDIPKEQSQLFPAANSPASRSTTVARVQEIKASAPDVISGFALLAAAPADDPVSLPAASIGEIMFITRPLDEAEKQDDWEITPPIRKPQIRLKAKNRPDSAKQKPQVSWWEQLPWRP